ncbi:MAG: hypothetical protein RJA48_1518, partial [Verrucomicrobiota bacterium]
MDLLNRTPNPTYTNTTMKLVVAIIKPFKL